MFQNTGAKLKGVAKIIFWIIAVLSWVLALFVIFGGIAASSYGVGSAFGSIIMGVVIAALGTLLAWLEVITLYAFGVITENTDKLVELAGGVSSSKVEPEKVSLKDVTNDIKSAAPVAPGKTCPSCGEKNSEDAAFCRHCGSKLD